MKTLKPFNNMPSAKDVEAVLRAVYPSYTDRKIKNAVARRMTTLAGFAKQLPMNCIKIKLAWHKNYSGNHPTWEAWAWGEDAKGESPKYGSDWHRHAQGGGIGGGGYDKQSTATAAALNELLKPYLFRLNPKWFSREKNDNGTTKSGMPYGFSTGCYGHQTKLWTMWDPGFDSGVGVSCHENIVRYLGGEVKISEGGKDWDLYSFKLPPFKETV